MQVDGAEITISSACSEGVRRGKVVMHPTLRLIQTARFYVCPPSIYDNSFFPFSNNFQRQDKAGHLAIQIPERICSIVVRQLR
jgi:hypothetical protein